MSKLVNSDTCPRPTTKVLVKRDFDKIMAEWPEYVGAMQKACLGLGRIIALHHRSSASYQIR